MRNDETSEPASGSLTANAAMWMSSAVPKHCGTHSAICSGVPLPTMPDTPRLVPRSDERDAGVAPAQLLRHERQREAGLVAERVGEELPRVEADAGGLLDDRPRRLFPLVPLGTGGPDDVGGEVVDPFLDLQLIFVEIEREVGHDRPFATGQVTDR